MLGLAIGPRTMVGMLRPVCRARGDPRGGRRSVLLLQAPICFIEGLFRGNVVGQASLAEMQVRTECACYGLGLHFKETPYGLGVGHSGGDLGILSEVRRFPDLDATLVLLVNGGDSGVTERLFKRLWDEAMRTALAGP